ncbi:MAG: hypothetical protein ACYTXC_27310 [Nostoc sp.]
MATLGSKVQYFVKKIKFFAMIARFAKKFTNFRFASELREANSDGSMIGNHKKNTPKDCFF